jgi:hypothetical protein
MMLFFHRLISLLLFNIFLFCLLLRTVLILVWTVVLLTFFSIMVIISRVFMIIFGLRFVHVVEIVNCVVYLLCVIKTHY